MAEASIDISIYLDNGTPIQLQLFALSKEGFISVIEEAEALEYGEAPVQLLEGDSYEYLLSKPYRIVGPDKVVKHARSNPSSGRISPGNYVGTLSLEIWGDADERQGLLALEVCSIKTNYRVDYRSMLEFITEKCTELLMQYTSPALQHFDIDPQRRAQTLYQRFAFVRSVLESPEFKEAIGRIQEAPVTNWAYQEEEVDIRKARKMTRTMVRQLMTKGNRINLPEDHYLRPRFSSLPATISCHTKKETTDTPENRFVKYVLTELQQFCSKIRIDFKADSRAYREALQLEAVLGNMLSHAMYKEVSRPSVLALNSPVLQRKEGYREVLRVWLMFDLAARLVWQGGEDVYEAGKRDVATLYEYWVFFVLLDIVSELFLIEKPDILQLIEPTRDGLGLKLKLGQEMSFRGKLAGKGRVFHVGFYFNRTFSGNKAYPAGGSWTKGMRPDYTLSFWPDGMEEKEAEKLELMVHLHFDAKYRVANLIQIMEEEEEKKSVGKRTDILKMHAYRDAIRRTAAAYVLYPGEEKYEKTAFHEKFPGLGAFPLRPSQNRSEIKDLKKLILEVVNHLLEGTSQREEMDYHRYNIHREKERVRLAVRPVYDDKKRMIPPGESQVLVGYCKNEAHYRWIEKNGLYNLRIHAGNGPIHITPTLSAVRYLLLHQGNGLITGDLRPITGPGPRIFSKKELTDLEYPAPGQEFYLVYEVEKESGVAGIIQAEWDIRKLTGFKTRRASALPFVVSLTELMGARI